MPRCRSERRCFAAENRAQTRSLFLLCREMPSDAEPVASRARAQLVAELVAVSFRFPQSLLGSPPKVIRPLAPCLPGSLRREHLADVDAFA